jgi:hypothetical protein
MVRCSCLQSYTTKISIKILFTILLTMSVIFLYISTIYVAWRNKIYFIYWHCKEWKCGDIMAKKLLTHCGSRGSFKTKTAQLAAIDGVGWCYLETQRAKLFLINNAELAFIRTNEINVAHFQGENYPERLKHCIDGSFYYLLWTN